MRLVDEVYMVWHPVDAYPVNGPPQGVVLVPKLCYLGAVIADRLVARHAQPDSGHRGGSPYGHGPVAEGAVQPELGDVYGMWKGDRLLGALVEAEDVEGQTEPGGDDEYANDYRADGPYKSGNAKNPKGQKKPDRRPG